MAANSATRWTEEETTALMDAYGEQIIQDSINGMANNRNVYDKVRKMLKEYSDIDRTTSQIETKIKKLRSSYCKLKDRMKQSGSERPYFLSALSIVEKRPRPEINQVRKASLESFRVSKVRKSGEQTCSNKQTRTSGASVLDFIREKVAFEGEQKDSEIPLKGKEMELKREENKLKMNLT
ncbi:uncharacterized protein LOC124444606 [Xenia sp. Carnegie-2017]|uniref:uncharacterized protein LOC124444606 n=1 Tax=Xenia sp. Carnegie-2017 TaxID=2897299 RepID=UPI001F0399C6|nr:uncharacterized protein LOC124444606 [Xenia sp. Carnegie-2017]